MRTFLTLPLLLAVICHTAASGQTLTATLLQEDAAALARAARQRGDAVRGAILYSQKKLNCSGCHQPRAGDLLGPDLTQTGTEVKDEHFVEAILQPSKTIKKEFQAVKLLTTDGRVLTGRVVRQSPEQIVLRDTSPSSRLLRLPRGEVARIEDSDVSAMPAGLADQLAGRQQFLDLVKYLMDVAATGQPLEATRLAAGGEVGARLQGLAWIDHFRCLSCHRGEPGSRLPAARAPDLSAAAARIDPQYLLRYILDPHGVKPGTSMPDVLGSLDEPSRRDAAAAIRAYLLSLADERFRRQALDLAAAARGKETFHTVGCVACHAPRDDDGLELPMSDSVPLGDLTDKYSVEGLAGFLEDPHAARPSGRMPDMRLTHWEAVDLANFLLKSGGHATPPPQPDADTPLVSTGRRLFAELRCANCHQPDRADARPPATPLAKLGPSRGCLSDDPQRPVRFELSAAQLEQIRAALEQLSEPLDDRKQIQLTMHALRCLSCHQRGELGGVSDERDRFFHSENENLGPQGRIPPALTYVGAKLRPKWLRQVLVSGRVIRPYVKTRMPQYGADNVGHLVGLLGRVDSVPPIEFARPADQKEAKKVGAELAGQGGLNCVACHTFQQKPAQTMPAVDLTEMAERLQRPWFEHYMRRPQSLSPRTVMPSFWPGGRAIRQEILDGDTDQQIAALWTYLLDGRQARTPRGLNIEPIELLASDEAVMLRRKYPGIGKRGIGVGLPGQVNLAFDAEQLRLAMIWRGQFADPGGVWRGQGSGTVRPLSRDVIGFAAGPDLDDAETPWVVDDGRPPQHQFTGYVLDQLRRPAFTYRFDDVEVEDYTVDLPVSEGGSPGLRRTIKLAAAKPRQGLAFRAASGRNIEPLDERTFRLDGSLRVSVEGGPAKIVPDGETKRLMIPLRLEAGTTQLVIQYTWQDQP